MSAFETIRHAAVPKLLGAAEAVLDSRIAQSSVLRPQRRYLTSSVARSFMPAEYVGEEQDMVDFRTAVEEGQPIADGTNHFSRGDHARGMAVKLLAIPKMRKVDLVIPTAAHQIDKLDTKAISAAGNIKTVRVINADTVKAWLRLRKSESLPEWATWGRSESALEEAIKNINGEYEHEGRKNALKGGMLIYAIQGKRESRLYGIKSDAFETVLNFTEGVPDMKLTFTGFSMKGITDPEMYKREKGGGINKGVTYLVRQGPVFDRDKFVATLQSNDVQPNTAATGIVHHLVEPAYQTPTSELAWGEIRDVFAQAA